MVERFEKHYKITENVDVNNAISVAISYNKGGTNLFTYNHGISQSLHAPLSGAVATA